MDVHVHILVFADFSVASSVSDVLQRYEIHITAEGEAAGNNLETEDLGSAYASIQTSAELVQTVQRYLEGPNAEELSLDDLMRLEKQLDTALSQTRARKTHLLMGSMATLQQQERALREENDSLVEKIAALKGGESTASDVAVEFNNPIDCDDNSGYQIHLNISMRGLRCSEKSKGPKNILVLFGGCSSPMSIGVYATLATIMDCTGCKAVGYGPSSVNLQGTMISVDLNAAHSLLKRGRRNKEKKLHTWSKKRLEKIWIAIRSVDISRSLLEENCAFPIAAQMNASATSEGSAYKSNNILTYINLINRGHRKLFHVLREDRGAVLGERVGEPVAEFPGLSSCVGYHFFEKWGDWRR
ncbi:hypothetical protein Ancab_018266 [Ancistrocladus abbreviatus]